MINPNLECGQYGSIHSQWQQIRSSEKKTEYYHLRVINWDNNNNRVHIEYKVKDKI